ncbi:MAG TPA: hypothetical protein VGJ92_13060 [Methanocella sp.]|jgi:hypothetical protein
MDKNDQAQWLLLSSLVVSFGIVALLLLLNTAALAGHSSIESAMDFPKNQIRDLRTISVDEARIIGSETSANFTTEADRLLHFGENYTRFVKDTINLYERQGTIVDITCTPLIDGSAVLGKIDIFYNDGNTMYMVTQTVGLW